MGENKLEVYFKYFEPAFRHGEKLYGCEIVNKTFYNKGPLSLNLNFMEKHLTGKTNADVHFVSIYGYEINQSLRELAKNFPNLKALEISRSISKLSKFDLIGFTKLEKLIFDENYLTFLPGDLFENFGNIECISFKNNQLNVIEPNILNGLVKLKHVDFRGNNNNYRLCFSIYSIYDPNATLAQVKEQLWTRYYSCFPKDAITPKEELSHQILMLKCSENRLREQVEQLKTSEAALKLELFEKSTLYQKIQKGIFSDFQNFIHDESTKDFRIQIEGREFPVHKFLLAVRSPTLAEILKNNPEVENLKLVDISVEIFEKILKFLYTDELPGDDGTNFLHLFAAAAKLKIEILKDFAARNVVHQINDENAMEILNLSNKYENEELRQNAFEEIKKMYPKIEFLDKWAAQPETLDKIIEKFKKKEEAIRKLEEEFEAAKISG